ncbi:hypothetical protein [Aetokthonos hydrillicola]|nr:hypothetical protein [Aetokthonos hydrillicola]MBW4587322.1 hypothetical protein [Aetokthonos hydrillicola CCALA 1050]
MLLMWSLRSHNKTQQALQWWFFRQSFKLFLEAEKIRDGLLQESFTIRRNLELLPVDNLELSVNKTQECLTKTNNFHQSLAQLSDRLCPAYLEDSLPLAIESLLESWLVSHPDFYVHIDMPKHWRNERAENSLIVLTALEELLRITLPEVLTQISIYISLKELGNVGQMVVKVTYPDTSTFSFYSNLPELGYLYESFRFLTSGKCFCRSKNITAAWYFRW